MTGAIQFIVCLREIPLKNGYNRDCLKMGSLPLVNSMACFLESMLNSQV